MLAIDRYNDDAYTLIDQVNKARIEFGENATDKSRTRMLWKVVEGWIPKVTSDVKLPEIGKGYPLPGPAPARRISSRS